MAVRQTKIHTGESWARIHPEKYEETHPSLSVMEWCKTICSVVIEDVGIVFVLSS